MIRFRSDTPEALVAGIESLMQLARSRTDLNFSFGPLSLDALIRDGLVVHGPDEDAAGKALTKISGLAETVD